MPKMKTHSGASKRFRLTGTGKIVRRRANRAHYARVEAEHQDAPPGWLCGAVPS